MKNFIKTNSSKNLVYFIILILLVIVISRVNITGSGNDNTEQKAVSYYIENYNPNANENEITAKNINFGCHTEIYIYEKEELVPRLNYNFGKFSKIG